MPMNNKKKSYYRNKKKFYRKKKLGTAKKTVAGVPKDYGSLVKLIKNVTIKQSENKYNTKTYSTPSALRHNEIYQYDLWGPSPEMDIMPHQGSTDGAREGDRIVAQGIRLRAIAQIPGDRRQTTIAVFFVPHNSEQGDPSADLFHNILGSTVVDPIQTKRWPGIKFLGRFGVRPRDAQYHSNLGEADARNSVPIYIDKFIPLQKKIYFTADASNKPSNLKEYGTLCFCPYNNISAGALDNIVLKIEMSSTLYFKDL